MKKKKKIKLLQSSENGETKALVFGGADFSNISLLGVTVHM